MLMFSSFKRKTPHFERETFICSTLSESDSSNNYHTHNIPLNLQWKDLKDIEYFASGGRSAIYTALFNDMPVMIKTVKLDDNDSATTEQEIEKEIATLSMLDHPNIVKLYGAGYNLQRRRFLILERLDGGTMQQMIHTRKCQKNKISYRNFRCRFWMRDVLRNTSAIARAMEYCHTGNDKYIIMHRDLKPDNIGFKSDGTLKIMDFGLATIIERKSMYYKVYEMSGGTGSLRYMAPEVAKHLPYNYKADVYSFGIILYELLSCRKAFTGLDVDQYFEHVVYGGLRPQQNHKWPNELNEVMDKCWSASISRRPSFTEVVSMLESTSINHGSKSMISVTLKSNIAKKA